jgi:hypothetical protein
LIVPHVRGAGFTPLTPLHPKIINAPAAAPGGKYAVTNLIDGNVNTEFASHDQGTNTVVEFDFGGETTLVGLRHVDRDDRATIAESVLEMLDAGGNPRDAVTIQHANQRRGETLVMFPKPLAGRTARWRVSRQGDRGLFSVGGAELMFFTAGPAEPLPRRDVIDARVLPFADKEGAQTLKGTVTHFYAEPAVASLILPGKSPREIRLKTGVNEFECPITSVDAATEVSLALQLEGNTFASAIITQAPARKMTIYILPHSHTDIGYTEIQSAVEAKQVKNVLDGINAARKTADYPEGARFVWNVEVGWAADLFLRRMNDEQRAMFLDAVKRGQVVLNGMYLNELTGLCRPEELLNLFQFATQISRQTGVPIDAAMISDVPGYTWGVVPAMAQAGIRYLSAAPNYFDRIGNILQEWENKPFYWVGPDGHSQVLVWIPFWGYAMSHIYHELSPKLVEDFYRGLEKRNYPYDIACVRWSGHGDNAVPDPAICDFVRDWNAGHAWPKFVISGTSAPFRALEARYGSQIPKARGDWSPYWEDGAASSALQTAQNRASSDRLTQAAALFALRRNAPFPAEEFNAAWREVLLYSEHTWGAWCSVTQPDRKETLEQWAVKRSYADEADSKSRALLAQGLGAGTAATPSVFFTVVNTLSWPRSELVALSAEQSAEGDRVEDLNGKPMPSQRLSSGELVFRAENVPALGASRYRVKKGAAVAPEKPVRASGAGMENGAVRIRIDETTGAIVELAAAGISENLADTPAGGLNAYRYLVGDDPNQAQGNGPAKISVIESGPLVASLRVESAAPGCKELRREVRLAAGDDFVTLENTVDKERLAAKSYMAREGKESLNFYFPFNVPGGDLCYDVPFGVARPETDQLASACKNWLAVNRWTDVANDDFGVTWVTLDAPLIEPGYLSATLLNSQNNPEAWRKKIERTQRFYSWAMNNHWGTNYRAWQEGPTRFRFVLRPHRRRTNNAEATRFAVGCSQPLLVASGDAAFSAPVLLDSTGVIVEALKPSDDGKALIIRLFGASGTNHTVNLEWPAGAPKSLALSDTSERAGEPIAGAIPVPGFGVVTLRAEY